MNAKLKKLTSRLSIMLTVGVCACGSVSAALPEGIESVGGLVSDGKGYVDTKYIPTPKTRVVMDFKMNALPPSGSGAYSGLQLGGGLWMQLGVNGNGDFVIVATDNGQGGATTMGAADLERHTFDASSGLQMFDFKEKGTRTFTMTSTRSLFLFAMCNGYASFGPSNYQSMTLYGFQIYEDGELVRDFIPCTSSADGAGLYELKTEEFFKVTGSTGFTVEAFSESATLTVVGSSESGSPSPGYGAYAVSDGEEIEATMDVTEIMNRLTGEERTLKGWQLEVRKKDGTSVVTTSEGGDISKCPFTPEGGDQIVLRWVWSSDPYGEAVLPDGYEPLGSLQFKGNDYLNTELLLSLDDQLVEVIDNVPGGQFAAFCTREYDNSGYVPGIPSCVLFSINGKWRFDYGAGQYDTGVEPPVGQPAALAVNAGGFYQNGELVYQADLSTGQAAHPLVLMASYWTVQESGEVVYAANFCQSNLQVLRVWDKDGSPKANLRPCRNTASGQEGLYDTVRQMFCPKFLSPKLTVSGTPANFANSGIVFGTSTPGAFKETSYQVDPGWHQTENGEVSYRVSGWKLTVTDAEGNVTETTNDADTVTTCTFTPRSGENIRLEWQFDVVYEGQKNAHIPQRYDEVEWIQFDGSTAIDTDYVPAPNQLKSQVRFTLDEGHDSNQMIFCARENSITRSYTLYYAGTESGQPMSMTVGGTAAKFSSSAEVLGKRVAFSSDRNQVRIGGQEWTTVGTFDPAFALAGGPMTFGASYSGSLIRSDKSNFGWFKFHSAKFWEGGDLVRWFVPCHDKITNASGLYDVVTGTFYSCWKQMEEGPHAEQKGLKILFY